MTENQKKRFNNWVAKCNEKFNNKFDYSKVNFINNETKVTIICQTHGTFEQSPEAHYISADGCKECNKDKLAKARIEKNRKNFLTKANKKYNDKFNYSKMNFINMSTKVTIICPDHGEFIQSPDSHLNSSFGCPTCGNAMSNKDRIWDLSKCISKFKEVYGDKFDYSKVKYVDRFTPVTIICPTHGEFETTPDSHIGSITGCQECGKIENVKNLTLDIIEFIEKAKKIHGSKYDYSKVDYINMTHDVTIICPDHGEFTITPGGHIYNKAGCKECYFENRITIDNFEEECNKKFNNKFDYSKVNYINSTTKIKIICPIHGEFEQNPIDHYRSNSGCPKCSNIIKGINQRLSHDEFIEKAIKVHDNKYNYSKVNYIDQNHDIIIICDKHGDFKQNSSNHLQGSGCPRCAKEYTKAEMRILSMIPDAIHNDRQLIKPKEIDILSHEHKLAIEYNGILFHSFGKTYPNNADNIQPSYHLNKTNDVESKGYQLFHVFENEWENAIKQKIWTSMINSKIQNTARIYARDCIIKEISNNETIDFLNNNHMQGYVSAKVNVGLFYENELVSLMTFNKPRFNKKYEWELIRFCSILETTIVGGASRLLKYFERNYNPESIISYANRRWSTGHLYKTLGFDFLNNTSYNYYYIDENNNIYTRNQFQKHMLKDKLDIYDSKLSERENMFNNNYRVIYDAGNKSYIKKY